MFKKIIILSFMFGSIFMLSPIHAKAADLACTIETPNGDIIEGTWINGTCQPNGSVAVSFDSKVQVEPVGFFERIKLFFVFNAEKKADLFMNFSNRNFELAKQELLAGNTAKAKILFEKSGRDSEKAKASASQIKDEEKKEKMESSLSASSSNKVEVLTAVQAKLENPIAKAAIQSAILRAESDVKINTEAKAVDNKGVSASGTVSANLGTAVSSNSIAKCLPTSAPSITVLSPNGGETYTAGQQITVKWKSCNIGNVVAIDLFNSDMETWILAVENSTSLSLNATPNDGEEKVWLPNTSVFRPQPFEIGSDFKIRVYWPDSGVGTSVQDFSDNYLKIGQSLSNSNGGVSPCNINIQANQVVSFPLTITGQVTIGPSSNNVLCPLGLFEGQVGTVQALSTSGGSFNNSWAALMIYDPNFDYQPGTYQFSGVLNMNGTVSSGQTVILKFTKEDPSGAPPASFSIPVTVQ